MKLKIKIFIGLTLWSLTSNYYSSQQQQLIQQEEKESAEIKKLLYETWGFVESITDTFKSQYNDGLLVMGVNNQHYTYIGLLRDSNTSYYYISIWDDGEIQFYDQNRHCYKIYSLLNGEIKLIKTNMQQEEINKNNQEIIKLLKQQTEYNDLADPIENLLKEQGQSTHEYRKAILEKLKGNLQSKNTEIQNIKTLFNDMIRKLKNNIKPNEGNIVGQWKSDDDGIFLENNENMIKIFNNSDIVFLYKDNNNQDNKDIKYIPYKWINLLTGKIWISPNIDQIKITKNNADIKQLLTEKGGDIGEDIITLLKIEGKKVEFEKRKEVLNSIIIKLKEKDNTQGLIKPESGGKSQGKEEGSAGGGSVEGVKVLGEGSGSKTSLSEKSELGEEGPESEEEEEEGPGSGSESESEGEEEEAAGIAGESVKKGVGGSVEGTVGQGAGGEAAGSESVGGFEGKAETAGTAGIAGESVSGLGSAGEAVAAKSKTWIIVIVVLSSVVFLLLSIYGISRKEENNDKKEDDEKVNTEKDTQIEPINIKEDNTTDSEKDNKTDNEEDNTTDIEEDSTDYESN